MSCSDKLEIDTEKSLRLPTLATYTLKNDAHGFADGTISVIVDDSNSATDIVPFWADDNGKLLEYTSLFSFEITGNITEFVIGPNILIPKGATRLLLYAQNIYTGEITEDYYEIPLSNVKLFEEDLSEVITEFQVISDVHIQAEKDNLFYIRLLEKIAELSPRSLGLFISGDVTNNGRISEYEKHIELHSSVKDAPNYYITIGNHEFYDGGQAAQKTIEDRFVSYARLPDGTKPCSQHYDFWLNGYHYVFLGNDGITKDLLSATFKDETMVWLNDTLKDGRDCARPIFLFCHYPIKRTVSGSLGEYTNGCFTGVWGENAEKLKKVISEFPEVILFTGHQHFALGYPNTMHKRDVLPTIFNTSSASQVAECYNGIKQKGSKSEGYFVYVYKDNVVVRGYNFSDKKWISSAQFCVELTI